MNHRIITIKTAMANAYLLIGDGVVILDTGGPGSEQTILAALTRAGVSPTAVNLILHTHGHGDHAGSSAALHAITSAPTAIHPADAPMLRAGRNNPLRPHGLEAQLLLPFVNKPFPPFSPDLTIHDGFSLNPYGLDAHILSTPGHTPGAISVALNDEHGRPVAIIGDVLRGGFMGGALLPARPMHHYFVDDHTAISASLARILALNPATLYLGHGGPVPAAAAARWLARQTPPAAARPNP